jgi:hypothetical protein
MKFKNTPTSVGTKKYKSKLEATCHELLTEAGIPFEYEPITYNLLSSFKYEMPSYEKIKRKGKKVFTEQRPHIRAITYTPDFVGSNWIIETKGYETEKFKVQWKLFKKLLKDTNKKVYLFKPTNKTEIKESIQIIKNLNNYGSEKESVHRNERRRKNVKKSRKPITTSR